MPECGLRIPGRDPAHRRFAPLRPDHSWSLRQLVAWSLIALAIPTALAPAVARAQTPPGTPIDNTAYAHYSLADLGDLQTASNRVRIVTVAQRTPATLEILHYAPTATDAEPITVPPTSYSSSGGAAGPFTVLPPPVPAGGGDPLDLTQPIPLSATELIHRGEPLFLRVDDPDQNLDPFSIQTVLVTTSVAQRGEHELLRLSETGPNTGVFVGYVPTSGGEIIAADDGTLTVAAEQRIAAWYTDVADAGDRAEDSALVDPAGSVFASSDGQPVDGVTITLIDEATGQPATVYGDDGVSTFPATIVSGGTASDSGGNQYDFPPGRYRFPFVAPGVYRLAAQPPTGFTAPSTVPTEALQQLPGAPFAIVEPGSRGEPFTIDAGPLLYIDIPVDPVPAADRLALIKNANRDLVTVGDFLAYALHLTNLGAEPATGVSVTDRLPLGFRYQTGSTTVDGNGAADPTIAADGRTLTFAVADLEPGASLTVGYVVEVAAGARTGEATNVAWAAADDGLVAREAQATTWVAESFFAEHGIIAGRVIVDNCGDAVTDTTDGIAGIAVYLEDGTYAVTDRRGRYHFEGVAAGVHVVQLDLGSLPPRYTAVACDDDSRAAGRAYSRFVDLQGGTLWRTNFHLHYTPEPIPTGQTALRLVSVLSGAFLSCRIDVQADVVPLDQRLLTVVLPVGTAYVDSTSRLDGLPIADPEIVEEYLTYRLDGLPADSLSTLRFTAQLTQLAGDRELPIKAQLTATTPTGATVKTEPVETTQQLELDAELVRKPDVVLRPKFDSFSATLSTADRVELDRVIAELMTRHILHLHVTGHSDNVPISPRGQTIFADNYVLSMARARSVGQYLAAALALGPEQITLAGHGPALPVATNGTAYGRYQNRRVELRLVTEGLLASASGDPIQHSDRTSVPTVGLPSSEATPQQQPAADDPQPLQPVIDDAWLDAAEPGRQWLWPAEGFAPAIGSLKLVIKHHPFETVELLLAGEPVSRLNFLGSDVNQRGDVAVSRWAGVDLSEGDNRFVAVARDTSGQEVWRSERIIHFASPPVYAQLLPERSTLVADGHTAPVIALRLTDRDDHPARAGIIGEFVVTPPHAALQEIEALQENPLAGPQRLRSTYTVGPDGVARIRLQATTQTGEVVLRLHFYDHEQEIRAWLQPEPRDWILVGLAAGTVGYNSLAGHMENLHAASLADDFYDDGRLAFYAKGSIKGEWLLTMAYDTHGNRASATGSLFQEIDPNTYYTLYGDATAQDYDAASSDKLYLKLERRQFYAMYGDYDTQLTVTELARYNRSFTGLKTELRTERVGLNLFANETGHGLTRDEIRGDGTSGLYKLSRRGIVINSDKVTIEVRDRFRSDVIHSTRQLTRYLDYDIDYELGTIYFKAPIYSKDDALNPIFIVANYEVRDRYAEFTNFGGRGAVNLAQNQVELGTTYIHQELPGTSGDLLGWDARWRLGTQTELRGEFVVTDSDSSGRHSGYLAELSRRAGRLGGRAYYRVQEVGFGLGQQNLSEAGTRKYGVDLDVKLGRRFSFDGHTYRQDNLANGAKRDVAEARLQWHDTHLSAFGGGRYANDRFADGQRREANQISAGASVNTTNRRLQLKVNHEQSLSGRNVNADFPTRTLFGADFELLKNLNLLARYELTDGEYQNTRGARLGFATKPWRGNEVTSTWEHQFTEHGERSFANLGLRQLWQISQRWSADVGLDHSRTLGEGNRWPNDDVPPASGARVESEFTAVTGGLFYRSARWQCNGRLEILNSSADDKWAINPSVIFEPQRGLGLAASARLLQTEAASGATGTHVDLRLGFALRPNHKGWIVLDRLDWISDDRRAVADASSGWRIVNNLNLNYYSGRNTQFAIQYGAKYVRDEFDQRSYSGYTDLLGLEIRQNLGRKFDAGLRQSARHSWRSGQLDYSVGVSAGYNLLTNTWLSCGYNFTGFWDRDFSAGDFTAHGPFLRFRFKFDQESAGEVLRTVFGGSHE